MALTKGVDGAGDFQVIVEEVHEAVRGGVELLREGTNENTPSPSRSTQEGGGAAPSTSKKTPTPQLSSGSSQLVSDSVVTALVAIATTTTIAAISL